MERSTVKILVVYGTRPEAIKMAPVIAALRRNGLFAVTLCATGQHREMLDQAQELFGLHPDLDLQLMRRDQTLNGLAAATLAALDEVLAAAAPDWLLVQGDTTTAMAAALAAFHRGVRVGHVEAGLRTGDLARPFPEEANRRIVDALAAALFAPTERAGRALLAEGCDAARVHVVGNTVIDALRLLPRDRRAVPRAPRGADHRPPPRELRRAARARSSPPCAPWPRASRASTGSIPSTATRTSATRPTSGSAACRTSSSTSPFDYRELVRRLARCRFVLTDSGGLQEEAPSFGKPVLVLRETTERPEGIEAGVARLVGTGRERIVAAASRAAHLAGGLRGDGAGGQPLRRRPRRGAHRRHPRRRALDPLPAGRRHLPPRARGALKPA